jgi:hypothetical protein
VMMRIETNSIVPSSVIKPLLRKTLRPIPVTFRPVSERDFH